MNTSSYISLGLRRWKQVAAITCLTAILSFAIGLYFNKAGISATVFISIGARQPLTEKNELSIYENVQAADQFAETVQGWFKNPDLIAKIENQAGTSIDFTARKQEKQNLVITYKAKNEDQAKKNSQLLRDNLKNEIAIYNNQTGSNFQLAIYSTHIQEQSIPPFFFAILGILIGFFAAILISYSYEYFFGFASYDTQIEEILGKRKLDKLPRRLKEQSLDFLAAFMERPPYENIMLAGVNLKPLKLSNLLKNKLPAKTFSHIHLPHESQKLSSSDTQVILICQLGKTKLDDLKKILTLLPKNFHLVISQ